MDIIYRASPNFGERPEGQGVEHIVLHYTGMPTAESAILHLCNEESMVSSHYVVDEAGQIFKLVEEDKRAWHAGTAYWRGERDLNSTSIGIEIVNPGHEHGYRDFPEPQMLAVEQLCEDILSRHPILAKNVVAHSDIAPSRKLDPGELFDWRRLAKKKIGLWPGAEHLEPTTVMFERGDRDSMVALSQLRLLEIGYEMEVTEVLDTPTSKVIEAFQRHYRPARIDGLLDQSTFDRIKLTLDLFEKS